MNAEQAIIMAAREWWRMLRPVHWSREQHIQQPTVNTNTAVEGMLAEAVARYEKRYEGVHG